MKRISGVTYVAALGALLALTGCGGHGGKDAAASPSANAQDAMVKFAECMRQHGVQVDVPNPGAPGVRIRSTMGPDKLRAAQEACQKYRPKSDLDPNDPKVRDRMLKTAQCLREHGVKIADPQPGQGLQIKVDKADTKTQQAMAACEKLMPGPGGGPGSNGG
jgi:hypothetical protein